MEEGILNSGEELSPADMETLKNPDCKVYYSRVKGSITHMPDGAQISFRGGMFATANKEVKAYLDKIADKVGSQIYTKSENQQDPEAKAAALAAMLPAGDQKQDGVVDSTKQVDESTLKSTSDGTSAVLGKFVSGKK
jgi:hypothetical protein